MARLASQSKGGYYATPEKMVDLISERLSIPSSRFINILDPCCGEGEVLKQIQSNLQLKGAIVTSYGNELEGTRYEVAKSNIDHVIQGGYEGLRTTPYHTFLYLNPPYDEGGLERTEVSSFRLHTYRNEGQRLQKGAIVCFCIPQYVLKDVANLVSQRLDDVTVYRFTDDFYSTFKQVVVFGVFREPKGMDSRRVREYLKEVAEEGPRSLPPLDVQDGKIYEVPESHGIIEYFRGEAMRPDELWKDLQTSPVFQDIQELQMPAALQQVNRLKRPPLPFKIAHMGLAITANAVDGNFGDFWLSGYTIFEAETTEIYDDITGDKIREEVVHRPIPVARIFHPQKGIIELR